DITQKGYEKKRSKLIGAYLPQPPGVDQALPQERRTPVTPSSSSRYHRRRSSGSRDERYRSDVHTEAVQAALAKHKERKMAVPMPSKRRSLVVQTSMDAYTPPENHSAPPDVTTYTSEHSIQVERPQGSTARVAPKYGNAELMETGDGVPVSSRVSAKIQQLVNTLKRPKRPPLREFFVDDFEELLEVQQPDPNQPKPEGAQMLAMRGEQLGVVTNWPPSLEAALQRWGTISPKAPCLTTMDTNGKPLYILTYGKLWTRSMKVAYNILHKLGTKQEPMVRPGDRVTLVFPNNDPAAFMVAFYGCLLAEVVPVPIEVPLTRK
ncbi:PREDICTED: disco-interacting protein 2 homolog C-like, partial [Phaethon lepturus]|uniref:disco-interacting protein 2 homolog C-like n=1 Tax=Phaethon lepturus TaxID=97097 RepID=UPI00053077E9